MCCDVVVRSAGLNDEDNEYDEYKQEYGTEFFLALEEQHNLLTDQEVKVLAEVRGPLRLNLRAHSTGPSTGSSCAPYGSSRR